MSENNINLSEYFKKLNDNLSNVANSKSTISEALNNFRQISKGYSEFDNKSDINNIKYSNKDFNKCTKEEQLIFYNDQLQMIECLVTNSVYDLNGIIWNWGSIFKLMRDKIYAKTKKQDRKVVFSTGGSQRPVGDISYSLWNGLQIIDIDIKNKEVAEGLKPKIFDDLSKYNWFLGIAVSASGKSLHVWTKITPISVNSKNKKIEYLCNFRHKYSYVYIVLQKYASEFGYCKEDIIKYMDMAMAKPQQGIYITSDPNSILNTNFKDLRLDVDFEGAFNNGIESINWISHKDLQQVFSKLEWFNKEGNESDIEVSNITNIDERDKTKSLGRKHYKHMQRWQLANTLTSIYGCEKALTIMSEICKDTTKRELAGDVKTAQIHNKPISVWAVKELNKQHGFKIKIKTNNIYEEEIRKLDGKSEEDRTTEESDKETVEGTVYADPIKALNDKTHPITINITNKQYLSDVKDEIISNLSHITLLEAGAGYGKTEMIKSLKSKILLILPFTSTIKAKIEVSDVTKDWLYFYGNKRPTIEDLMSDKSMSMTIDKFSNLNIMELDQSNFEYIVIDESHLLFTSSYRDVMAPTIQRLVNCKAKIIMMTGTPTGELLFFPNITHIKVIKDDYRQKQFYLNMCPTKNEQIVEMCKSMCDDIIAGKKILFPTNRGNLWASQIVGLLQQYLTLNHFERPLKPFYYKKSNYGDESMDKVNIDKSIGSNDIVFCTTYLSVGIDICDRYTFSIYFNEPWIPQDIEQFANRLRNNDLFIKMFLPKTDSQGMPINYYHTQPLDLNIPKKELLFVRDLIRACNDMLERNEEESKYNPIISSMISSNKYLKYDENDCKYYVDETQYKLDVFEERYSDFSKQLEVMLNGMRYYGYCINIKDYQDIISEEKIDELHEYMKTCRQARFDYMTIQTFKFLDQINDSNIDLYRDLLRGDYSIFKDEKYALKREENNLYAEDIEVIEKNIPIILGLYKFYDCDTIKDIFKYCIEQKSSSINYAKLDRIRRFVNIEYNRKRKRLDFPVMRYIKDAQDWAKENPSVTNIQLTEWLQNYAAKYANTIKNVVVDDIEFLKSIYDYCSDLWRVIIMQSRPKNGKIYIEPFELLWDKKKSLNNIYETNKDMTSEFFLTQLENNMKTDDEKIIEIIPELEHTAKKKLTDVENELQNVIQPTFDYTVYADKDGSNSRFLRKQENIKSQKNKYNNEEIEEKQNNDNSLSFEFIENNKESLPF